MCTTQKKLLLVISEKISDAQPVEIRGVQTSKVSGHFRTSDVRLFLPRCKTSSSHCRFTHFVDNAVNSFNINSSIGSKPVHNRVANVHNCNFKGKLNRVIHRFNILTTITRISLKESL